MANILSSLVQAIPAILTGFQGRNNKPQQQTASDISSLARASYDMDSPQFQGLYKQNRQANQQSLAEGIAEISRQNRKLNTMGRRPLLDQERGGESIFRNLMLSNQGADDMARRSTFDQLSGGVSNLSRAYDAQGGVADQDWQNKLRKVGSFYSIGDAMRGLGIGGQAEDMNDIIAARQNANRPDLQQILKALMGL